MFNHILLPVAPDHNPHQENAMCVAQTMLNDGGKITVMNVAETIPHYAYAQIPEALMHQNVEASKELVNEVAAGHENCEPVSVQAIRQMRFLIWLKPKMSTASSSPAISRGLPII